MSLLLPKQLQLKKRLQLASDSSFIISPAGPAAAFRLGVNYGARLEVGLSAPTIDEMSYMVNRGINTFRLPLSWNGQGAGKSLQQSLNSALDATYMAVISACLANAKSIGATILIDIHAFGFGPGGLVGNGTPISSFVDLWTKLSIYFRADPSYSAIRGYDLMNEWHNMDPNAAFDASTSYSQTLIRDANLAVLTALRAAGDHTKLYLEWDHYSGAWDSVTNNISMLMDVVLGDPFHNSIISVHGYLDNDSSGTNFVWANEIAKPGLSPPGLAVNVNIGAQRLAAVVALAQTKRVRLHIGETGWSNDGLANGGNDDYADWNLAAFNYLTYCQQNNIEIDIWGPGFPVNYGYNPEPSSVSNPAVADYTSTGLQSAQMVVLEKFSGYTGSQPLAYRADSPFGVIPYSPSGTPLANFKIRYNGVIGSTQTYTGHAKLPDGTDAAGTFSSISNPAADNGIATFSYTPSGSHAAISLTFTNSAGLTDPPAIGASSLADFFTGIGLAAPNIYALRRLYNPYIGPAVRLQRADSAQLDFYFNNRGDLPRQAIQDWASTRTIQLITLYDQSPNGNHLPFSSSSINLILDDGSSYPSINITAAVRASGVTPSIGQGKMTAYAEINPANNGDIFTQDLFSANFRLQPNIFVIAPNSGATTTVSVGATLNVWSDIAATYDNSLSSSNLNAYIGGSLVHTATAPQFVNASFFNAFDAFNFRFGDQHYLGFFRGGILHYTAYSSAVLSTLHGLYNTYFTTPLPDTLTTQPPLVSGAGARTVVTAKTGQPFHGVTITDPNFAATISIVITLSGTATGTLAGTGLSGTGPYTLSSDTPANVTTKLQALIYTPVGTGGTSETFSLAVTSSTTQSTTNNSTVVSVYDVAAAETPYSAPGGSFTPVNRKGINISGGEKSYPETNPSGFDYSYPLNAEIDYWSGKGFGAIRMPVDGTRLQPFCYGALDPASRTDEFPNAYRTFSAGSQTNLLSIKAVLDYARSKNMFVVVDLHNFGFVTDNSIGITRNVGTDAEGTSIWRDKWKRIATKFKNYDNVIWDPMNEPISMTSAQWKSACDLLLADIAAITTTQEVWLEGGGNFSGAHDWVSGGNAAAFASGSFTPPAGLTVRFQPHQYLDSDDSGTHSTVVAGKGATVLSSITSWAVTNGYTLVLGEFGWSPNDSQPSGGVPSTEGTALAGYMSANPTQWVGWTYWLGGSSLFYGSYVFTTVPAGYPSGPFTDAPQTSILVANQ